VPREYVFENAVLCICETMVTLPEREFAECPNGCRWFMRDGEAVWAARLPVDDSAG
jgi:hypothetical protein